MGEVDRHRQGGASAARATDEIALTYETKKQLPGRFRAQLLRRLLEVLFKDADVHKVSAGPVCSFKERPR
jgi:hypothetical protein